MNQKSILSIIIFSQDELIFLSQTYHLSWAIHESPADDAPLCRIMNLVITHVQAPILLTSEKSLVPRMCPSKGLQTVDANVYLSLQKGWSFVYVTLSSTRDVLGIGRVDGCAINGMMCWRWTSCLFIYFLVVATCYRSFWLGFLVQDELIFLSRCNAGWNHHTCSSYSPDSQVCPSIS